MNDQATSPGCPDLETISAIFDGEHVPDETVREHLHACPDCARRLADYGTIRGFVSQAVSSEPDAGFNARIASFVRAEAAKMPLPAPKRDFSNSRTAWIFRIAALFILSGFFVYLLVDQMHAGRAKVHPNTAVAETSRPFASNPLPVMDADRGAGDFVKARLVSNTPSSQQYAIDIDPMLVPDEFGGIPGDSRIPLPLPPVSGPDGSTTQRIPLRESAVPDAMLMLEQIRRDLISLNVPGLSVDAENRGRSLFTTIRLESAGRFDMSVMKTDDNFELFLMSGDVSADESPLVFCLEFFFE